MRIQFSHFKIGVIIALFPISALCQEEMPCAQAPNDYFRLSCLDQRAIQQGIGNDCILAGTDHERLACYQKYSTSDQLLKERLFFDPNTKTPNKVGIVSPSQSGATNSWFSELGLRPEFGVNYSVGRYDGNLKILGGQVRTQAAFGGSGILLHYGLWWDGAGPDWLSLGLDHVSLRNSARVTGDFPKGLFGANSPSSGRIDIKIGVETTHINVAARSKNGSFQPYGQIGIGGGRGWVDGGYVLEGFVSGGGPAHVSSWLGDIQSAFGFDWRPIRWLSIGPDARVLWFTARPFGINQQYIDLSLGLHAEAHF